MKKNLYYWLYKIPHHINPNCNELGRVGDLYICYIQKFYAIETLARLECRRANEFNVLFTKNKITRKFLIYLKKNPNVFINTRVFNHIALHIFDVAQLLSQQKYGTKLIT